MKSGISIVIPAYNEEFFLPATLISVNEAIQFFCNSTGLPAEAIVVNNASTDRTDEIAQKYGASVVYHEVRNISSVRNFGIRSASYDLIVTIDADCTVPIDALTTIWQFMQNDTYVGAALGVKVVSEKRLSRVIANFIQLIVGAVSGIHGAMFVFRKNMALEIGGFPEDRLVAEDSAFAIAMRRHAKLHGKKFGFLKSVKVGTLERKNVGLFALPQLILQVIRAFAGAKQKPEDLEFWYKPNR